MPHYQSHDDKHAFLLCNDGRGLQKAAWYIPAMRDVVESLPATKSTFRPKNKLDDDFPESNMLDEHVEFAGAWPVPERFKPAGPRLYVNPNAPDAHRYADAVVQCRCGASFPDPHADHTVRVDNTSDHAEGCLLHDRIVTRGRLKECRYGLTTRLVAMGWDGAQVSARLGSHESLASTMLGEYDTTIGALRDEYRWRAGNTYDYLVHDCGVLASDVADIYGHAQSTMTRWAKKYSGYEPLTPDETVERRRRQMVTDGGGAE